MVVGRKFYGRSRGWAEAARSGGRGSGSKGQDRKNRQEKEDNPTKICELIKRLGRVEHNSSLK